MSVWPRGYRPDWLKADVVAGLTVWALVVPEAMAYAGIAGVPVEYGLYAVPLAVVAYAVFGTSRRLFVGPSSTIAALRRGPGAVPAPKSFALLSVSSAPPLLRKSAVVLLPAAVVVEPSPQSALP